MVIRCPRALSHSLAGTIPATSVPIWHWSGKSSGAAFFAIWFDLSDEARQEAERVSGLAEVNSRLRVIHRHLSRRLRVLSKMPSPHLEGVTARSRAAD